MKKIMFSDKYGLTQAVLEGWKTMTRRIVPQSVIEKYSLMKDFTIIDDARYNVGEVIAIAQSYRNFAHPDDGFFDERYEVKDEYVAGWANKMFVRADLLPHHIRITNVCVWSVCRIYPTRIVYGKEYTPVTRMKSGMAYLGYMGSQKVKWFTLHPVRLLPLS